MGFVHIEQTLSGLHTDIFQNSNDAILPWRPCWSPLGLKVACGLFGAKPIPEPMTTYGQLNPEEQTSVTF